MSSVRGFRVRLMISNCVLYQNAIVRSDSSENVHSWNIVHSSETSCFCHVSSRTRLSPSFRCTAWYLAFIQVVLRHLKSWESRNSPCFYSACSIVILSYISSTLYIFLFLFLWSLILPCTCSKSLLKSLFLEYPIIFEIKIEVFTNK